MAASQQSPARPQALSCPRCGYDLRGIAPADVASAASGRCSECGQEFAWADVFDPSRVRVSWLYEHTTRRLGLSTAWATLVRVALPWIFWRIVPVTARVSHGRLLLWLPVLIVPLHIVWTMTRMSQRLFWLRNRGVSVWQVGRSELVDTAAQTLGHPLVTAVRGTRGWIVWGPNAEATFLLPLGATILAPLVLLILTQSRATSRIRASHVLRAGVYGAGWIVGWYALWTLESLVALYRWVVLGNTLTPLFRLTAVPTIKAIAVTLCLAWFGAWWYFAVVRGMKLHRARLVWLLLMIACLLLGLNAALFDARLVRDLEGLLRSRP